CPTGAKPAIKMYANYIKAGDNSRAPLWGKNGAPVNTIHGNGLSAGWGWNNDISYTEGDTFFISADKESVFEIEIFEWQSTNNEWSGTSFEKIDSDTIKVTALSGQKLFLSTYQDYLSAGYTKVTVSATYASGDFWVGNDVWVENGYMHSLASGNSIELDMSKMDKLCLFFNAAMSDVEITYVFGGLAQTETLFFEGESANYTVTDGSGKSVDGLITANKDEEVSFTISANDGANTRTFVYYNGDLLTPENGVYSLVNLGGTVKVYVTPAQPIVYVADDGKVIHYAIVIPDIATDTQVYAADELQYFVNEITGVNLPVYKLSESNGFEGRRIIIGSTDLTSSDIPQTADALCIKADGGDLLIGGYGDRGELYGVYELVESMGVKFLTSAYTHIPETAKLTLAIDILQKSPAFAYAAYYTGETHDVTTIDKVKYTSRLRFVHQFTGENMDNIYYAPNGGNDQLVYGAGGTLSTIEATDLRMDWFANGAISSSHNAITYAALGVYAMRDSIADWYEMIEFGYATGGWYWGNDSTPATLETTWGGYDAPNIKPMLSGEIAYESIRLDTAYITANYGGILYPNGSDLCYSSGVLKDTTSAVTAVSLVKAGIDFAIDAWGENNQYFMLGYTDQEDRCTCSTCNAKTSKSTISGTVEVYQYNKTYYYYKFVQEVANDMLAKHPDKKLVMFAYSSSSGDVPSTGSLEGNWLTGYDPYIEHISVNTIGKLPANVYVQWAPIWLDEAYALSDTTSAGARTEVAAQIADWSAYVQNNQFMHWGYDNYYFIYSDTLSVMAENIELAKQYGFASYMVQASNSESILPEMSMKSYVLSKAVWYDGTVTDALVEGWRNEFIRHYYGDAAYSYVIQYYNELNQAYQTTFAEGYKTNDWALGYTGDYPMIPADTIKTLIGHLNNAISAVGADTEYANHINLLKFTPRYMYVNSYGDDTSGVVGTEALLRADMKAAGVKYIRENVGVDSSFTA
ncbi:MAG: DUF4838 domain-containing protein, partial [Clostridia bacterium]|nr:DUF4838 domain-containing protein [Clostridia bacterium]